MYEAKTVVLASSIVDHCCKRSTGKITATRAQSHRQLPYGNQHAGAAAGNRQNVASKKEVTYLVIDEYNESEG
jgi:hypothetical protein